MLGSPKRMKFEELLMEPDDEQKKRRQLEEEVMNLKKELHGEEAVNKALNWAIHGPLFSHPCLSPSLPPRVQVIIEELIAVEGEISKLERRLEQLKLSLHEEREQNNEWELQQQQWRLCQHNLLLSVNRISRSLNLDQPINERTLFSSSTASDIQTISSTASRAEEKDERWRSKTRRKRNQIQIQKETMVEEPNEVSEELIKCLISIYLDLNQVPLEEEKSEALLPINRCIAKSSFTCKSPHHHTLSFNYNASNLDPYNVSSGFEGSFRDIGPYNNFIQIKRASLDVAKFSDLSPAIRKLRNLMQKLGNVDLTLLTYKQKLAFWINIYNASIMHAFLEHGFPSTHEKLLALMNKAELNVGGIVLNALAIEHFILRPPSESKHAMNEKEAFLRHIYGLVYPEPNVTFALCRGSWSSPALRVYTPDEVVNELRKAKVEYLEASVGVTRRKKKIILPKLLDWHMRDFADDVASLLEWIYSQLPTSSSLKTSIMNSLNNHINSPTYKILQIQPYRSEFRYLLPI